MAPEVDRKYNKPTVTNVGDFSTVNPISVMRAEDAEIAGAGRFGRLTTFTPHEHQQLEDIKNAIVTYIAMPAPKRPLSIGVFGPPGSGKSFAVDEICAAVCTAPEVLSNGNGVKLAMTTLNLSQFSEVGELADALLGLVPKRDAGHVVPIIFFDEFDARLGDAPWGWLSWFLAPMQDGDFRHRAESVSLKRAIYFFAGGTADFFDEFASNSDPLFRAAKGPDFVSRLRGFLDVCGPNSPPAVLRRVAIVRHELRGLATAAGRKHLDLVDELSSVMVKQPRFRHGARSIGAVLAGSLPTEDRAIDRNDLPRDEVIAMHVDDGPLDARVIGGCVAFSGGGGPTQQEAIVDAWKGVARELFRAGATIAYGGSWAADPENNPGLCEILEDEACELAPPLRKGINRSYARLRMFSPDITPKTAEHKPVDWVLTESVHGLTPAERASLETQDDGTWLCNVVALFRMRLQVSESSVFRVAVGGKLEGYAGRYPGVAEEIMLSLRLGRPLYVLGAFDGAARDVGQLLALDRPWLGTARPYFKQCYSDSKRAALTQHASLLRPPPWQNLPVHMDELVEFLCAHAIGGPAWPQNGLTVEENRLLFREQNPQKIAEWIMKGIRRYLGLPRLL